MVDHKHNARSSNRYELLHQVQDCVQCNMLEPASDLSRNAYAATCDRAVDLSQLFIDATSADPRLVERCLTHLANHPPQKGLGAVRVYHKGTLEALGENTAHLIANTFQRVTRVQG